MLPVSDAYKSAIIGNYRKAKGLVEFEILDVDANLDATATVTSEEAFSKKTQIYNQQRFMSAKYATFEPDYWKLDGTFGLPPKSIESGYEVGWWSSEISEINGAFTNNQVITTQFTQNQSSIGITITFDVFTGEYAADFIITVYDASNNVLATGTITGNTNTVYVYEQNLTNYRKVVVSISKWCKAGRRARCTEIDFGIIKKYTDNELIDLKLLEEIEVASNRTMSNEVNFTIDNQSKAFNILNPSGIYPYLQRKQKIKPYLGLVVSDDSIEYVPLGIFYLTEWKSDEGTLTATFTARDSLAIANDSNYPQTTFSSKTIKYIIDAIMTSAGISNYVVDSALSSVTVSGTIAQSSHREALQTAAIAGKAVVYCDRYGVIQIKRLTTPASQATIDYNNSYNAPQIKLDKLINTVIVKYGASTYTLTDPAKPSSEPVSSITLTNALIGTLALAQDVASWLLTEYKKRNLYEINWRTNPALEIGDIVTVEDDFSENKTMRITKNEFNYQGYLSGKTNGRG